ncbi:DUF6461 domain-containing protein [Nonomuraea jiangxiensis]|uniref:Uncharacterized protein n=1 Tax=Nonomuraea jiangxiensis TaxID=633440 RepID=A0A1G8YP32_9ACTN|nr:DUF6461 domain-containing protein [Nonomuraea jiangxiensis]SDK04521.1 hypothetical protein SAMN05421869_113333 [Nonomuraea jiangxiensis]
MATDDLYQLLRSYDPSDASMQQFYAVWVEGIPVEEAVVILNGDPASGAPDSFSGWGSGSDGSGSEAAGLLFGRIGNWTLIISDYRSTEDEALLTLSGCGRRILAVSWDFHGETVLKYARDGELVTVLDILDTSDRSGSNPNALDPYLHGLRFNIDDDDPGEPAIEPRESFTSALTVIGRMVGHQIDRDWLESTHTTYLVPADDLD